MLSPIVWIVTIWPLIGVLIVTTAQPYIASRDLTAARPDGSPLYVTPDGIIGGQDQLVGYRLVPANEPYYRQPAHILEQPLVDKLAELFLQHSLPLTIDTAGYGQGQTSDVYQTSSHRRKTSKQRKSIQVSGQPKSGYSQRQVKSYGTKREELKEIHEPVYVPVPIKREKRRKKKSKTLSVSKGFYIAGGSEIFGKFKTLKSCQKACDNTAHCFGGDYNKWTKRCYMHTNTTACSPLQPHKQLTHFKKVPCSGTELGIAYSRITLGTRLDHGLLQKGIKDIQTCIKKCLQAGGGVAGRLTTDNTQPDNGDDMSEPNAILGAPQLCFGIDYDFATHKCFFHTSVTVWRAFEVDANSTDPDPRLTDLIMRGIPGGILCFVQSNDDLPRQPENLVADSSVVNIVICPQPSPI